MVSPINVGALMLATARHNDAAAQSFSLGNALMGQANQAGLGGGTDPKFGRNLELGLKQSQIMEEISSAMADGAKKRINDDLQRDKQGFSAMA